MHMKQHLCRSIYQMSSYSRHKINVRVYMNFCVKRHSVVISSDLAKDLSEVKDLFGYKHIELELVSTNAN